MYRYPGYYGRVFRPTPRARGTRAPPWRDRVGASHSARRTYLPGMTSVLSPEQVEFFMQHNWLKVDAAVPPDLCAKWVAAACQTNDIDLADSSTWPSRNNFISAGLVGDMAQLAPKLYGSIVQLVGGPERLREPALQIDSGLVANWDRGADSPWVEPGFANEYDRKCGGECGGWHTDGDFNHFVDSPETGLQVFILWGDVVPKAGPTYIAPDSPRHLTKVLLENPGGLSACALGGGAGMCSWCHLFPTNGTSCFCTVGCEQNAQAAGWTEEGKPSAEIGGWPADLSLEHLNLDGKTGSHNVQELCKISMPLVGLAGTAYFVHPQMLHTSSQNMLRQPRFMRNLQIPLAEPRPFVQGALSPVERCILRNFGGSLEEFHRAFTPPPPHLRMACDHDDGTLLDWKYGEAPSYKGAAPQDPGHVLSPANKPLRLTPSATPRL